MANVKNNASAKETKRRLIEAAGQVFAEYGFERATIKEITERADASTAAVNYHFSDKQELYDQVIAHTHSVGQDVFDALGDIDELMPPEERLHQFIDRLLNHVLDPTLPDWHCQLKAREMQNPSRATEQFIQTEIRTYVRRIEKVIQDIVGRPIEDPELTRLVNSIISQCVFYAHNREFLLRLYPDLPPPFKTAAELSAHITKFSLSALSCWRKT